MKEELDKEKVTCPYCGYEYDDSHEFHGGGTTNCENCEKKFRFEVICNYDYSTYSLTNNQNENK